MSRIIISAGEQQLTAGIGNSTTVDSARFVRVYNNSGAAAVVFTQDANYAGIGSITVKDDDCLLYTSPSPRDQRGSRMPSSA